MSNFLSTFAPKFVENNKIKKVRSDEVTGVTGVTG